MELQVQYHQQDILLVVAVEVVTQAQVVETLE